MSDIFETETKIKQIIDELKALSAQAGLANQGEEEQFIPKNILRLPIMSVHLYNRSLKSTMETEQHLDV